MKTRGTRRRWQTEEMELCARGGICGHVALAEGCDVKIQRSRLPHWRLKGSLSVSVSSCSLRLQAPPGCTLSPQGNMFAMQLGGEAREPLITLAPRSGRRIEGGRYAARLWARPDWDSPVSSA